MATQGRANSVQDGGWFVKTYTLAYSKDGDNWVNYKEFGIAKVRNENETERKPPHLVGQLVLSFSMRMKGQLASQQQVVSASSSAGIGDVWARPPTLSGSSFSTRGLSSLSSSLNFQYRREKRELWDAFAFVLAHYRVYIWTPLRLKHYMDAFHEVRASHY